MRQGAIKRWIKWVRERDQFTVDDPIPQTWLAEDDFADTGDSFTLRQLLTRHGTVDLKVIDTRNLDREMPDE